MGVQPSRLRRLNILVNVYANGTLTDLRAFVKGLRRGVNQIDVGILKPRTTKDTKYHEGIGFQVLPSLVAPSIGQEAAVFRMQLKYQACGPALLRLWAPGVSDGWQPEDRNV